MCSFNLEKKRAAIYLQRAEGALIWVKTAKVEVVIGWAW